MILFYNKKTGKIVGTLDGRLHDKMHLNVWIGDKKENDRIVVNWIPAEKGFKPDHPQEELFRQLDQKPIAAYDYKVDLKTKELVLNK